MSQDLTNMCKGLHGWHEYERGVEALSKVVASDNNRESSSRKALSFPDLLIKEGIGSLMPKSCLTLEYSQSRESVNIPCYLMICVDKHQFMTILRHMPMLKRRSSDFRKRSVKSTKRKTILECDG